MLLPDTNEHALADEARLVRERGLEYHSIPVEFAAPSEADYLAFIKVMDALSDAKVFVHCAANMRVTAFMARYGRERLGWSEERARELVAEVWAPNEIWRRFLASE